MSHLNNSNNTFKCQFTVLTKIESLSSNENSHVDNDTSIDKTHDNTDRYFKDQVNKISTQLTPACYTLHRFGVEVTKFGIGDGLGWDLTSIHRDDGTLHPMILYPGDVLELAQPEICVVPRKVDDFMESRKSFFQGKLLVCIANDHHLSVLYGIEKRTIQLARYYGDKLLSEPDGKILDECRWTVLGAVENIIRPYPSSKNNFTQTNISGKHWQVSLTIPSNLLETSQNTDYQHTSIAFNLQNISTSQVLILQTIGELIENQFQAHAEMNNINALTSFIGKHIPQIQITLQSHHKPESKQSNQPLPTPIKISNNLADSILGTRLKPVFLFEGPKYKNTMLSHYQRNRKRRRLEHSIEISSRYMKKGNSTLANIVAPSSFIFNEDKMHRLIEERLLKERLLKEGMLGVNSSLQSDQENYIPENYVQETYIREGHLSIMKLSQKISK
jgi:hypothetical protein